MAGTAPNNHCSHLHDERLDTLAHPLGDSRYALYSLDSIVLTWVSFFRVQKSEPNISFDIM